jgi:hypothetical protein
LESGWSCAYDPSGTLLCQQAPSVDYINPPTFFEQAHVRAIQVG